MDSTAKLWDVETGEEVATLAVSYLFFPIAFSAIGAHIYSLIMQQLTYHQPRGVIIAESRELLALADGQHLYYLRTV